MSIKEVSVVTPTGEHTIMTSIDLRLYEHTVRQQVMKHVTIVRHDARKQCVIKISHQSNNIRHGVTSHYPSGFGEPQPR